MAGAQSAAVNRTRIGPKGPVASSGLKPGGNGQAKQEADAEKQDASQEAKPNVGPAAAQPAHGIQPAWDALSGGIGEILKDPQWMQHPLLHVFHDLATDPGKDPSQDLWAATQWWGRVVNAAFDPNAIHAAASNIEHDNSIQGHIAQSLFQIHADPISEMAWNVIPYALSMAAEWPPWMWAPAVAAGGPTQASQVPQALMGLVGGDLQHPQFKDPEWYARMGSYMLALGLTAKGGGKAAGPLLKFSGRLKALEPFAEHMDRLLGGPAKKTPIKGPDGQVYDPESDPTGHAFATWYNTHIAPVAEGESVIGKPAVKPQTALISHPDIEGAYSEVPVDPTAKTDFAKVLSLPPTASKLEVQDKFFAMVENRELTPAMSAQIAKNWDRYGSAIGMTGNLKYWHPGEAPLRNVKLAYDGITDAARQHEAMNAMKASMGFVADLRKGIHGYGNDLSEALVKGILDHGRSATHYQTRLAASIKKVLPTAAERERVSKVIEAANLSPEEGESAYQALVPHEKWAVDLYRRLAGEVRAAKLQHGLQLEAQPNFFYRVPKARPNLDAILKGLPASAKAEARIARGRTPFGYVAQKHRAFQLVESPEGEVRAEAAYPTTKEANAARAQWREQIKADLRARAIAEPALKAIVADPAKLEALAHAEIPDFSTDILDSLLGSGDRGMFPDLKALYTHQVMETAKRTLVLNERDGQYHPLAIARSESGQESSPTLSDHFKTLHDAETTTDFYKSQGWRSIDNFGSGHIFHSSFANPLNTALRLGDARKGWGALLKLSAVGKKLIMLNPMWHSTNMAGRFGWLTSAHPEAVTNALLKARGMKELNPEQASEWWQAQEYEAMEHGLLPPQLNEDVTSSAGKYHSLATGDTETGLPLDVKAPIKGFEKVPGLADAVGAVKGVDSWWQNHVNGHMWNQIHNFGILAYVALKDDALSRGMSPGDARLYAASQANAWAGMVSPDRWMNSPAMYNLSQLLLFAPNWWRTFPRLILNSYDRMGMKSNPALTHAWALNTTKSIGTMILMKGATDNALNWLLSGHWQFQNPAGYQNSITMDRFGAPDPKTGAHLVAEDPFERQVTDLERALGIEEAIKYGHWKPEFAEQGTAEVVAARASPLLQALETASNFDLYNTIKQRALRWVDPTHPNVLGSAQALMAGVANLSPVGYTAQAALQGATAQPQKLDWGPFAGTTVPGWAARAFDPNDPLVPLLSLLGVRGGYPAPIKSEGRGMSSDELMTLHKYADDWNNYLTKQQAAVMSGGMTWSDWAYNYKRQAAAYSNQVKGLTDGTSDYMQGADGLLSQYESFYNDAKALDANGDINWNYVQRQQDALQAKTDPATWRQMIALKDKREMQFPVLRAYKDSLQNYRNFQDTWSKQHGLDGETLRGEIADGAGAPNFQQYEAKHPQLAQWYQAKRQWELQTKQGFAYGLFTDNQYVMRVVAPHGTKEEASAAEQKILPQIEEEEKAGEFVTPSGQ